MRKKEKCYVVISKDTRYTFGAFRFSPEGKEQANEYVKSLQKKGGDYLVVEK